ncbi:unnamed protein product, partial [Mesorhabditis belari]|uniref:PH domain-containing protein n=1 Tax=Mesorhabditis belari TaxID=2138241 RepID=A0AAF3FNB4_9BILA
MKYPSTNTGQSLRNEYFTQKRLREAERRNLLIRDSSEEFVKEIPRPELLDQYRSPNQGTNIKSVQDDPIDHPPQQLSMGYQEFRQDRQSAEMTGTYQEQLGDSLGYEEMAHVELHIEGDSRGIKKEQVAHTHIASSQGNQKPNERVPTSHSHETQLIDKHEEHPHEHKHKTILGKTSSAINRALENLHIKKSKKETRSGSSGSEGSRKNTQEIHIVSQAIADPQDPDNIENRLLRSGVPHVDKTRLNQLERAHEVNEIHFDQQPLSETESDASTVILKEKPQEESISATVHVHRQGEHIHTKISQSVEEIHGVEPRFEPPIPPRAPLGSLTPPPIPPKSYRGEDDAMYVQYNQPSPIPPRKVPTTPISTYNPYTVQSEIDKEVIEVGSVDREVMEANRNKTFSPEPVIDEAGYAVPERVLSPPPESNKDKKWTWKGTNLSSRSRTPTDYEVANLMAETARIDLIHEYQTSQEIPHMVEPNHVKSPVEMERVLSPVLSREHEGLTKLRYDDELEEQLRASILHATKSLTQTEKKQETKPHKQPIEYASINRSPATVHQQFDATFSTTSSISSTDIVHEVMSRRNLRLDGVSIRPIDTTITPPSTPMTNLSSVPTHSIGDYLRSTDSHLSTHHEHEFHDLVDGEKSESKKSSPIYDEVARDSSVNSSIHTPTTPTPIAAKRSPTTIHKSIPSPQAFAPKSPITTSNPIRSAQISGPKSPNRYEFVDGKKEAQFLKSNLLNEIKEKAKNHEYDEVARDEKPKKNEKIGISNQQQQGYHHVLNTGAYTSTVETSFGDENVYEEIDQYQINAVQRAPPPIPQSAIPQRVQMARETFAHKQDSSEERRYEGNRYHDEAAFGEIGEDEALDWELIYTTNAIRQMSRNNKWRESILNKDRIPKPPKKQQKEIPDVLPKNSPFVAKTVEPPRSKTPTSWTKNEGFTFSVPGIQRIDSEETDDPSLDLKERWGKILNEESKGDVWKEERVERKHVPPHVTNIGATGSQIRVPSVPLPVQHSHPQPINLQKPQNLPQSQRSPSTPDAHYYQGFVKDIRQIYSQPNPVKWERSQSVGNIYEVPRGNPRLNQSKRETQPIVIEKLDRPVSTPNVTRTETVTTPTFVKQSTSSHVDTPARETFSATSPARLMSPRRLESPRPRPVDLSSLRADREYRFYSLRTPSPSTPKRTPSPVFREYAQVQSRVESTSKDEPIYDEVQEVQEVQEIRQPSPVKQFYSPTWQRIEQEIARSNAQYIDETTQHYHEHRQHHEVHRSEEAHHHQDHHHHQHVHHQHVHHHPETRVENEPHDSHHHHHTDYKHLNGHSKMSDEERFVIIGLARPKPFVEATYEAVERKGTSNLEVKESPNNKLTPTEGGKWQVERYEDEDVEKRTIPVFQGHVMHDGREMTVFPLASAHHVDQVHYQLGENQRPPGIPEHIDLTNAEEVVVETKTKVVTTVKRRALTGELFEENYSSESSGFPRSVHMDSPVQRLYGAQTLEHPHLESPLSRRSPRREMIGDGASPIYDTVHSTPDHSHSQNLGAEDRVPATPLQEHFETQRSQPEYRSIGTSPPEKLSPDAEGQYFDRNGELRRSWPVKTYEGNQLQLGTHKYKLKKMPDLDSGIGSGERPSPERNGEETPALRDWDPRVMLHALYELSYQPRQETKRDRFVNMEGHVEVPSDETATVAELERNWKEQYMKTKDGRLQVFVTHYAGEAPVQDVSLHGIEIDANREDRTLLVHGGKEKIKVLLRIKKCDTAETFDKWRQALLSHAAASRLDQYVEPVQRALPHISKRIVILELGSTSIRAGILHQKPKLPQVFFPAIGCVLENGQIIVGNEAYEPQNRQQGELVRAIQCDPSIERYTVDKAVTRACIERVIRELAIDPTSNHVLLSLPQNIPSSIIGELLQTLLGELGFRAAGITRQPSLILYSYDVTTGVVVDIGDRLNIVPVIDGYMVESAVVSIPMGAQQIRDSLRTSLASHNKGLFSFQTPCERLILRYVMEHSTYVPSDYDAESRTGGDKKSISLTQFRPTPSMPTQFEIDDSRFTCTEGLFRPKKWALESKGIHQLVHDSVTQSPIDSRRTLYKNIFLGGGASLLPGLAEKLEAELAAIVPSTIHAQVHISPWRYHAAFLGAQVFASASSFEDQCIGAKCGVKAQEIPSNHQNLYERSIRSFPYSMTLVNLVPTARENVYVADLSKNWKTGEEDIEDLLETLQREDQPSRKQKRYACRFKFCRIFDA